MKDKVLAIFKAFGFDMETEDNQFYRFEYEGKSFLYFNYKDNDNILSIGVYSCVDKNPDDELQFNKLFDKVNDSFQYVKAKNLNDSLWLFYEREMFGDDELKQTIIHMVYHLNAAYRFLHNEIIVNDEYYHSDSEIIDENKDADNETDSNEDPRTKTEKIIQCLERLGRTAEVDMDGDVVINYQMKKIFVIVGDDSAPYVEVRFPNVYEIKEDNDNLVLIVCNKLTRDYPMAQVFIDHTFKYASARYEFVYTDEVTLEQNLGCALVLLSVISSLFLDKMIETSKIINSDNNE